MTRDTVLMLARNYWVSEFLAVAAARTASDLLARGDEISADTMHEHVDRYRLLLIEALCSVPVLR